MGRSRSLVRLIVATLERIKSVSSANFMKDLFFSNFCMFLFSDCVIFKSWRENIDDLEVLKESVVYLVRVSYYGFDCTEGLYCPTLTHLPWLQTLPVLLVGGKRMVTFNEV